MTTSASGEGPTGHDVRFVRFDRDKLRTARARLGLSQEKFAEETGVTRDMVTDAEGGKRMRLMNAFQIVKGLDLLDRKAGGKGVRMEQLTADSIFGDREETEPSEPHPGSAPLPPSLFVGRDQALREVKQRLIQGSKGAGVTSKRVIVRGLAGLGKTSLAARIAHDAEILQSFPDGLLWVALGSEPDVLGNLRAWGRSLGAPDSHKWSETEAPARLAALLTGSRRLLIVDDVWKASNAQPFETGGLSSAMLLTTRDTEVAFALASQHSEVYPLPVLSLESSLELIALLAPDVVRRHRSACADLARMLEGLPLALQVAGRLLNMEETKGLSVMNLLTQLAKTSKILELEAPPDLADFRKQTTPTVAALLRKSTDCLRPQLRRYLAFLSEVRAKPAIIDTSDLKEFWDVDDPAPIAGELVARGLLEHTGEGHYQIHYIMLMHAKSLLRKR